MPAGLSHPVTALFTWRPELKSSRLMTQGGPHFPGWLRVNECGPGARGGQALPSSSDGFWPQHVLWKYPVVMGNKGVEEGESSTPIKVGGRDGKP